MDESSHLRELLHAAYAKIEQLETQLNEEHEAHCDAMNRAYADFERLKRDMNTTTEANKELAIWRRIGKLLEEREPKWYVVSSLGELLLYPPEDKEEAFRKDPNAVALYTKLEP